MKTYIDEVKSRVQLEEGTRVIEQLLIDCFFNPGMSTKQLARKVLIPVPVATAIKKECIKAGVLQQDRGVRLTPEGKRYVENDLGYGGVDEALHRSIMSGRTYQNSHLDYISNRLEHVFQASPQVQVQLDQSKCTPETSLKRAMLSLKDHSFIGKKVLCVGDDDLVSISLALLLKQLFPQGTHKKTSIHVVDVDERFLAYIGELADRENLPITCHHLDLRQPVPQHMRDQYDCVFTDPPYTLPGMSLFVSRAISFLKGEQGLPIFLSYAHKSPEFSLSMQREWLQMGLAVTQATPQFNEYEGAQMIGNRGQMIVLKTTADTSPGVTQAFDHAIYTGEMKRTRRVYRCKQCSKKIFVGNYEPFCTIEQLKNEGCPRCRHHAFYLMTKVNISRGEKQV